MINETGIKGSLGLTSRSDAISAPLFRIGDESLHRPILSPDKMLGEDGKIYFIYFLFLLFIFVKS